MNKLSKLVDIRFARHQMTSKVALPANVAVDVLNEDISISIDEIEEMVSSFNLSASQLLEVEKASRVSIEKAAIVALKHVSSKHASKPKKVLARKITDVFSESANTALAEIMIEVAKYGGFATLVHYVKFDELIPYINEHVLETGITFTILACSTSVILRFFKADKEE